MHNYHLHTQGDESEKDVESALADKSEQEEEEEDDEDEEDDDEENSDTGNDSLSLQAEMVT